MKYSVFFDLPQVNGPRFSDIFIDKREPSLLKALVCKGIEKARYASAGLALGGVKSEQPQKPAASDIPVLDGAHSS